MCNRWLTILAVAALGLGLALSGCSRAYYKRSADREVYSILEHKAPRVDGMPEHFTIEQSPEALKNICPVPAGEPAAPQEPVVVSLEKALQIAALNSRSYQNEKERVYLTALNLTLARYRFDPHFFGFLDGDYDATGLGDDHEVSARTGFGFSWLLKTGALLSIDLASDFSAFLSGAPRKGATSTFSARITQPLLQGAGIAVTEPLVQAQRDLIYDMRSFVQFRRRFFVRILSDYYRVLQNLQVLANEENNYQSLLFARDRAQALSEAGRLPPFQVDQAEQDLLRAKDRLEFAQQRYESSLDSFRVTLGLPPETPLELDPQELERLTDIGVAELDFDLDAATALALERRLDLMTANDRLHDAERKVEIAANDLLPGLDLSAALASSSSGPSSPLDFESRNTDFNVGFELDLPLDKLSERNEYRRRLIELERQKRNQCEVRDGVVAEVRETWRQFQRTRSTYTIAADRVKLAQRRVESTEMLLEAGRAIVRDVLEAREDLLSAQNDLAAAIVDYRVARLELARDLDVLSVSETGQLEEDFDEYF